MIVPALTCAWLFVSAHQPLRVPMKDPPSNAVATAANAMLDQIPWGGQRVLEIEGKPYVFVVERHYHPPGAPGPTGWHKGITVYEFVF